MATKWPLPGSPQHHSTHPRNQELASSRRRRPPHLLACCCRPAAAATPSLRSLGSCWSASVPGQHETRQQRNAPQPVLVEEVHSGQTKQVHTVTLSGSVELCVHLCILSCMCDAARREQPLDACPYLAASRAVAEPPVHTTVVLFPPMSPAPTHPHTCLCLSAAVAPFMRPYTSAKPRKAQGFAGSSAKSSL